MLYENIYDCPRCGTHWHDVWDCQCDDRCPECNLSVSPTESIELQDECDDNVMIA